MRRARGVAFALLLGITLIGAPGSLAADQGARLAGRVVDADGRAIEGAEVIVRARASGAEQRARTDASGAFVVASLRHDSYLVEARVSRGARSAVQAVSIGELAPNPLELRVDRAAYEEQVVVTAEARPQPLDEVGKAIAVVDADEMASRDEGSIAEGLRRVAGVQVRLDGGPGQLASLRIRGLRSDATAVLIDGFRFQG